MTGLPPVLLAILAVVLAGCGGDDASPDPPDDRTIPGPSDPEAPLISYTRSGGIAFTVQMLEVTAGGDATLTLQQGPKPEEKEFQLEEAELSALTDEVQAIDPGEVDAETEIACADCYEYQLVFPHGEELSFAEYPDPPSELDPLLSELNEIVEANSPANPIGG